MKRLLLTGAALLMTATAALADNQLPACDNAEVAKVFANVARPYFVTEQTDYDQTATPDPDASKKFCYAYFASPYLPNGQYSMGGPFQEAVFTLEWTNKAEGKWWLQLVQRAVGRKYEDQASNYPKNMRH
jgi:hypothetical protein